MLSKKIFGHNFNNPYSLKKKSHKSKITLKTSFTGFFFQIPMYK